MANWPTFVRALRRLGTWAAILLIGCAGVWGYLRRPRNLNPDAPTSFPLTVVHRENIDEVLTVGGEIEGEKQTAIDCELKNIPSSTNMGSFSGHTIISLVPDGAHVKKGDVLCRFDASSYQESARVQEIELEKAKATLRQAQLDLDSARVALSAYRDGEVAQLSDGYQGKIALMKSDLQRARQKLAWTKRMFRIQYISSAELTADQYALMTQETGLARTEGEFRVFRKYTVPKVLEDLRGNVRMAEELLEFAQVQHDNQESRLAKIRRQIEACTIRAPHDGLLVHADVMYGSEWKLREGMQVHEGQPLFFLPDLEHLVAGISLHESVAERVRVGMKVRIRMPAFPGRVMTGRVVRKNLMPTENWRAGFDIMHFEAKVAFDDSPKGALPNMSVQVEIVTDKRDSALVVASEALTFEKGNPFCYVAVGPRLERRPVRIKRAGKDLVEVVTGLSEGDEVILRPSPADLPGGIPTVGQPVETAVDASAAAPADDSHPT